MAAMRYFGADVRTLSCRTFAEVFQAVRKGRAAAGIVPVENSILGSIPQNIDLLWRRRLAIVGEVKLRIRLCLLALPGATFRNVRTIVSQAQALGQCEKFLRSSKGRTVETAHDTAGSARLVRERGDRS